MRLASQVSRSDLERHRGHPEIQAVLDRLEAEHADTEEPGWTLDRDKLIALAIGDLSST